MPKQAGLSQSFYIGGRDISGDVSVLDGVGSPRGILEVPNLADAAMARIYGLSDGHLSGSVWFNDATDQEHDALKGLPTADVLALWALGQAQDDVAAMLVGKQINYDLSRSADGGLSFTFDVEGSAGVALEWGVMFTTGLDTQSSSGNTASKNDGSSSSAGLAAMLHISAINSGTPTATIEDSANDSSWATLKAFAAVANGAEPAAERVTISGTVDQYLRIAWTGSFSNCVHAIAYRRGESVDIDGY